MSTIESQIQAAEQRWKRARPQREAVVSELRKLETGGTPDLLKIEEPSRLRRRLTRIGEYDAAERLVNRDNTALVALERVIKQSQLFGIEFFERGLIAARAVARVEIRGTGGHLQGYGSGVLISPQLFLTNNHVLPDEDTAGGSLAQFEYLTTASGAARDPHLYRIRPDIFFITNPELDISIVALENQNAAKQPLEARGWCPLIAGSGKAIKGERVNIIQHPSGERMQVTVRENTIVAIEGSFLQYEADTQPGSSGAPVFNDQWEMAAIHHAGVPKRDASKRILTRTGQPWSGRREDLDQIEWIANEGVRISSLMEYVDREYVRTNKFTAERRALWEACSQPPRPLELWDLFGGTRWRAPAEKAASHPMAREADADGGASWLFRLSFGPVSGPGVQLQGAAQRPAARSPAPTPASGPTTLRPDGDGPVAKANGQNVREAAERFAERFRHKGPYYDAKEDREAAEAYWDNIDWSVRPKNLFENLRKHLETTHTKRHSYADARLKFLYPAVDLREDGKLHNIYSGTPLDPAEAIARELAIVLPRLEARGVEATVSRIEQLLAADEAFDAAEEAGEVMNCEHVVPQSWFDKEEPMRSDLHHLFACEPGCNSFRGNIPYWQFPAEEEVERDLCGRRENDKFEPEHGKGPVARATLYFLARYPGEVGNVRRELTADRLPVLLRWHEDDPVDTYERHRNWLIFKAQGNRNPFIDRPEAATEALLKLGFGRS